MFGFCNIRKVFVGFLKIFYFFFRYIIVILFIFLIKRLLVWIIEVLVEIKFVVIIVFIVGV